MQMTYAGLRQGDPARHALAGGVLALLAVPLYLFVPAWHVEVAGLSAAGVGAVLLAARVLDLLLDPLAGHLCRSPRRARAMLLLAVVLMLAGAGLLMQLPVTPTLLTLFTGALAAFAGWSLLAVPLLALGAALPADDRARAALAVAREAGMIGGTLLALVAVATAGGTVGALGDALALLWWSLFLLAPLAVLALWRQCARAAWGAVRPWRDFVARSRRLFVAAPFRRLLGAYFLNAMANGIPATLLVLYVTHVLFAGDRLGLFLAAYLLAGLLALPGWLWLAGRLGHRRAWQWSMGWAAGVFALVPLLGAGQEAAFFAICVATGLSLGADNALPAALQARVAAQLRARSDGADDALVFGWWGLATKLALAAGAALALWLVDAGGFRASAPDDAGRTALVLAYAALPVLLKLAALWLARGRRPEATCEAVS